MTTEETGTQSAPDEYGPQDGPTPLPDRDDPVEPYEPEPDTEQSLGL